MLFTYQKPGDDGVRPYPPHLKVIPSELKTKTFDFFGGAIFDTSRFLSVASLLGKMIPERLLEFFHDYKPGDSTFRQIEQDYRSGRNDGFLGKDRVQTIGTREDWFYDHVFAQQAFTGTNPTTIRKASPAQIDMFKVAAKAQNNTQVLKTLDAEHDSFYALDCSYFREAVGLGPEDSMQCTDELYTSADDPDPTLQLFLPAAITLFHLGKEGRLHPVAIVIDFKGSIEKSVTIFNKRLTFRSPQDTEANDWPWRYAKTCAQVSDWVRHELTIHLNNTHLVEEAIIVAANRAFSPQHAVFRLLRPHWSKTLSLNASARAALVPEIIEKLVGVPAPQVYKFINHAYKNFHFTELYVPTDLKSRGFDPAEIKPLEGKFHNYGYGYNVNLMWEAIRRFVAGRLASQGIDNDEVVASDKQIRAWCDEMQSPEGARMPSFPTITTLAGLIDAVTMCIHIASPQHTAVNYLQEYYQSFVVNKPPALCMPLPQTLAALARYTEHDLIAALPISRPKSWLLASHVPHLLSPHVVSHDSLLTFALTYREFGEQHGKEYQSMLVQDGLSAEETSALRLKKQRAGILKNAAERFYSDLNEMSCKSVEFEKGFDDRQLVYKVLQPSDTASSIII